MTFINVPPIETLTLPRLVLIRGNDLLSSSHVANGFALSLVNSMVNKFVLPALVEITAGSMQLYNSTWCGYYTVNWEDIFEAGSVHLLPNTAELNFMAELEMSCPSEDRECKCVVFFCGVRGSTTVTSLSPMPRTFIQLAHSVVYSGALEDACFVVDVPQLMNPIEAPTLPTPVKGAADPICCSHHM